MIQKTKVLGLRYDDTVYYAMFINLRLFDTPDEIKILTEEAGWSSVRRNKDLLIAPLRKSGYDGGINFTYMPETLAPREPYMLSQQFVRDKWEDIQSGAILNVNKIVQHGLAGWGADVSAYCV